MPSVYDTQTNLNARGKYAPSVNYYATVREPNAVEPRLEKVKVEPINIDFTSLANAITDVKGMEIKQEQAREEREYDKWKFTEQQAQARELADLDMAYKNRALDVQLRGQDLNYALQKEQNDINRIKALKEIEKSAKDHDTIYAKQYIQTNQRLKEALVDFKAGNIDLNKLNNINNEELDKAIELFGNADLTQVRTYSNSFLGLNPSEATMAEAKYELDKNIEKFYTQKYTEIDQLIKKNPGYFSGTPEDNRRVAGDLLRDTRKIEDSVAVYNSPYASVEDKQNAVKEMSNNGLKVETFLTVAALNKALKDNSLTDENRKILIQDLQRKATDLFIGSGIDPQTSSIMVDKINKDWDVEGVVNRIYDTAKKNKEYAANLVDTMKKTTERDMYSNFESLLMFNSLPNTMQQMILEEYKQGDGAAWKGLSAALSAAVKYTLDTEDGRYNIKDGEKIVSTLDTNALNTLQKMYPNATNPAQAVEGWLWSMGVNAKTAYNKNMIDADTYINNLKASIAVGTQDLQRGDAVGMVNAAENIKDLQRKGNYSDEEIKEAALNKTEAAMTVAINHYMDQHSTTDMNVRYKSLQDLQMLMQRAIPEELGKGYLRDSTLEIYKNSDGSLTIERIDSGGFKYAGYREWMKHAKALESALAKVPQEDAIALLSGYLSTRGLQEGSPIKFRIMPTGAKPYIGDRMIKLASLGIDYIPEELFKRETDFANLLTAIKNNPESRAPGKDVDAEPTTMELSAEEKARADKEFDKLNTPSTTTTEEPVEEKISAREESMNNLNVPIKTMLRDPRLNVKIGASDYFVNGILIENVPDSEDPMEAFMRKFNMIERPSISAFNRAEVQNKDNTHSTIEAIIREIDGTYYVLPTVWDGKKHSVEEADDRFLETFEHLGGFTKKEDAEEYYVNNVHKLLK